MSQLAAGNSLQGPKPDWLKEAVEAGRSNLLTEKLNEFKGYLPVAMAQSTEGGYIKNEKGDPVGKQLDVLFRVMVKQQGGGMNVKFGVCPMNEYDGKGFKFIEAKLLYTKNALKPLDMVAGNKKAIEGVMQNPKGPTNTKEGKGPDQHGKKDIKVSSEPRLSREEAMWLEDQKLFDEILTHIDLGDKENKKLRLFLEPKNTIFIVNMMMVARSRLIDFVESRGVGGAKDALGLEKSVIVKDKQEFARKLAPIQHAQTVLLKIVGERGVGLINDSTKRFNDIDLNAKPAKKPFVKRR